MLLCDRLDSPSPPARRLGRTRARPVLDSAHIMRELGVAINALRAAYAASPAGSADEPESQAATGNAPRRRARTQSRTQRATRVPWPAPPGMPAIRLRMQHLRMLVSPSFLRAVRSSDPVLECARALLSDPRRHSLHASLPHRFSQRDALPFDASPTSAYARGAPPYDASPASACAQATAQIRAAP